jgi:hypothetical protein
MKKQNRKLSICKATLSNLGSDQQSLLKGGALTNLLKCSAIDRCPTRFTCIVLQCTL